MGSRPSDFILTTPGPVRLYSTAEMLTMKPPSWLIDKILPAGGLVGVYGPPGVGKTFVVLDMALSVGSGRSWQGHAVEQGYVLYVSAEGGSGIGKRIHAWTLTHNVDPTDVYASWCTEPVFINLESDGMAALMDRILNELEVVPNLIVLDTLARCFDGDENQQEDMGRFIAGVDRLRKEFDSTVIVVHHTRLDGERERGNTAFRGAADAMVSLAFKKGKLTFTCNKQKDAEAFDEIELELKAVPSVDSCVVVPQGYTIRHVKADEATLECLAALEVVEAGRTWDDWFSSMDGMPKTTFHRHFKKLEELGLIAKENGVWRAIQPASSTEE